jgi:hypothetical protein
MEITWSNYYEEFYLSTGRPDFKTRRCVSLCIATFNLANTDEYITREFLTITSSQFYESVHSEIMMIIGVEETEEVENW